jgi:small conductance mechanosensitive channel
VAEVRIGYGEDVDRVIAVMQEVGRELRQDPVFAEKILDELEIAGVDNWADSAIVLRCRFKTAPIEQWGIKREFLKRLKLAFDRHGIEIPVPHLKVVQTPHQARGTVGPQA